MRSRVKVTLTPPWNKPQGNHETSPCHVQLFTMVRFFGLFLYINNTYVILHYFSLVNSLLENYPWGLGFLYSRWFLSMVNHPYLKFKYILLWLWSEEFVYNSFVFLLCVERWRLFYRGHLPKERSWRASETRIEYIVLVIISELCPFHHEYLWDIQATWHVVGIVVFLFH